MPYRSLLLRRAFGAAILVLSLAPLPASAHAILESSTPAAGGSVPAGTVAMQFHYNSRIDRQRSRLVLTRPDHSQTTLKIAADDPPEVLSATTDLTPGSYSVRWQVLAIDGHITRGDVRFTVSGP